MNKKNKKQDDFRQLKTKLFFRTVIMLAISVAFILLVYVLVLKGAISSWTIRFLQFILNTSYDEAYSLFTLIFRDNRIIIFIIAVIIVFFVIFRIYLNWFTKYFKEINKGIGTLVNESSEDVEFSPELYAVEEKINGIKHTLTRRKLDSQLAEQKKNDLLVYLAHDLKTPLASVIGYLNLLKDEGQISPELREKYLSISLDKAEHLEDLINEFFEISKFNLSSITLSKSTINLTRLLEMLIFEFQPMLLERSLTCNLNIADNIMLYGDGDKLQRVFDNLLRNAVLYSYSGSEINISAACYEDNVMLWFSNKGATIPSDKLERIFEQFYRLDAARSSQGGAGLGLAIARQIVELHGGTISAKSENEVTVFEVKLPQTQR